MAFNGDHYLEQEFLKLKEKYDIKSVIETGTYYADTTKWLSKNFDEVYSCEINKEVYDKAIIELNGYNNVECVNESSETYLKTALEKAKENIVVFLDAHWYANPLLKEIKIIGDSGKKPIVVIHDFKVPGKSFGYDVYPGIVYEWLYIEKAVNDAFATYNIYYNEMAAGARRGAIFIIPTT